MLASRHIMQFQCIKGDASEFVFSVNKQIINQRGDLHYIQKSYKCMLRNDNLLIILLVSYSAFALSVLKFNSALLIDNKKSDLD